MLQIFEYNRNALLPKVGLLLIWTVFFLLPLATSRFPFENVCDQNLLLVLVLVTAIPNLYFHYLASVARTAFFTLDADFLGYQDCYVRGSIPWDQVVALTRKYVLGEDGSKIYLKLGLKAVAGWKEFAETVVQRAGLQQVEAGGRLPSVWKRM